MSKESKEAVMGISAVLVPASLIAAGIAWISPLIWIGAFMLLLVMIVAFNSSMDGLSHSRKAKWDKLCEDIDRSNERLRQRNERWGV